MLLDYDGMPQNTPASDGPKRRLVREAVLQCTADNVGGAGTYPSYGKFVELFITEEVKIGPTGTIYAEIVGAVTPLEDPDFHANIRLVK